jgi:dihydroneopterin aldolase
MNAPMSAESIESSRLTVQIADRIFIRNLNTNARIGFYEWEKLAPQPVVFDLELTLRSSLACHTDRLSDTVDYGSVIAHIREFSLENSFDLVEALGEAIVTSIFSRFAVSAIALSITKVAPFPGVAVGIKMNRRLFV